MPGNRHQTCPLAALEALAYDRSERPTGQGRSGGTAVRTGSLNQPGGGESLPKRQRKLPSPYKTQQNVELFPRHRPRSVNTDASGTDRQTSIVVGEEDPVGASFLTRSDVDPGRSGRSTPAGGSRTGVMYGRASPTSRWGWEARLREAEADLHAVKARRAGSISSSKATTPERSRTPRCGARENRKQQELWAFGREPEKRVDDDRPTKWAAPEQVQTRFRTEFDTEEGREDNENMKPERSRPSRDGPPLFPLGQVASIERDAEPGLRRYNTTSGIPDSDKVPMASVRRLRSEVGVSERSAGYQPNVENKPGRVDEGFGDGNRIPGVGDRWASNVLLEELKSLKSQLQKARDREADLLRQLEEVTVERDSIRRMWESDHKRLSEFRITMESTVSTASEQLRCRLRGRSKPWTKQR